MKNQNDWKYKENINNNNIPSINRENIIIKVNGTSLITLKIHN